MYHAIMAHKTAGELVEKTARYKQRTHIVYIPCYETMYLIGYFTENDMTLELVVRMCT